MAITVREILSMPQFHGFQLVAGASGLGREVLRTTVGDSPDCWRWSQGGELVITSGYAFQRPEEQNQLIQQSCEHGNAAVGIKFGRYIEQLAPEAAALADRIGFPVIAIPVEFSFADILHPVQSRVIQDQAHLLRYSETVRSTFFSLSLQCASLEALLETLRNFTHMDLALMSLSLEFNCVRASDEFGRRLTQQPLAETLKHFPHEAIALNDRMQAYLIFDSTSEQLAVPWNAIPIAQAKGALLLFFQRWAAQTQAERRYRNEFVQDILTNNLRLKEEVWGRAKAFGWNLEGPQAVVVFDIDNYKNSMTRFMTDRNRTDNGLSAMEKLKTHIFTIVRSALKSLHAELPFAELSDSVAFILPLPSLSHVSDKTENPDRQWLKRLVSPLLESTLETIHSETGFTVSVGIGEQSDDVFSCWKSYEQAKKALELTRSRLGNGKIAWWHDMGAYRILDLVIAHDTSHELVAEFIQEQLGTLIDWDREHSRQCGELFRTLCVLAAHNWSKKECAEIMSLHYNTLKYRWNKICELTERDYSSSDSRFATTLAIQLYQMNNNNSKILS